ncbi:MAG: PIN domain-containing protein [Defluviitaleaceae bacterium]|nr:PIN domain-containing protein [Defluviitaleaceae bacterium]
MKVIIDTNIIIDVYQNRAGLAPISAKILKLSERKKITGVITASTITDIYFILGRRISDNQKLKILVQKLLTTVTLIDVLASDVIEAFNLSIEDFEDALLAQCAKRIKADCIVTRNLRDFIDSPVVAMKPDDFLKTFFIE